MHAVHAVSDSLELWIPIYNLISVSTELTHKPTNQSDDVCTAEQMTNIQLKLCGDTGFKLTTPGLTDYIAVARTQSAIWTGS